MWSASFWNSVSGMSVGNSTGTEPVASISRIMISSRRRRTWNPYGVQTFIPLTP